MSLRLFPLFDQFQRAAQVLDRVIIGKENNRLFCSFAIIIDGFLAFIGKSEVVRKQAI